MPASWSRAAATMSRATCPAGCGSARPWSARWPALAACRGAAGGLHAVAVLIQLHADAAPHRHDLDDVQHHDLVAAVLGRWRTSSAVRSACREPSTANRMVSSIGRSPPGVRLSRASAGASRLTRATGPVADEDVRPGDRTGRLAGVLGSGSAPARARRTSVSPPSQLPCAVCAASRRWRRGIRHPRCGPMGSDQARAGQRTLRGAHRWLVIGRGGCEVDGHGCRGGVLGTVYTSAGGRRGDGGRLHTQACAQSSGCRPTCRTGRAAGQAPVQASDRP
jgi:hypothetical protein